MTQKISSFGDDRASMRLTSFIVMADSFWRENAQQRAFAPSMSFDRSAVPNINPPWCVPIDHDLL